jgi:hypothetical protein
MNRFRAATAVLGLVALALLPPSPFAQKTGQGRYLAGDFHNHTTFSDGSTGADELIRRAVVTYGLDWFAQSGHGGKWSRDGRIDDPQYDGDTNPPGNYWVNTVGAGNLKGDYAGTGFGGKQNMWKWQIIQEFLYPITSQASMEFCKPIWAGLEWQVPGHEHCSTGIITEQFLPRGGNADAMAEFEYLFDMEDNDTSGGGGQGWGPKIPNPPKTGTGVGLQGHAKAVAAARWMQTYHPFTAYMIPAHIERKGPFSPDRGGNNNGYSIEHFRDLNNAAPTVCFGFEGQPGHQADPNRGGFGTGAFGGTYGGTGYYTAAIGGLWDALLGEGRNFWLFASSDWHTREVPEFDSGQGNWLETRESANDFWPGEYQKDYVFVKPGVNPTAMDVLNGLRSGNSFIVQGDLITALEFEARTNWHANIMSANAAAMGQTLPVKPGEKVTITVRVKDPDEMNYCPYAFNNPSLAQIGIYKPMNRPELDHVDLIGGSLLPHKIHPSDPRYTDPTNGSTEIKMSVKKSEMTRQGDWLVFTYEFVPEGDCYFRLRGTNLPAGTPNETDLLGNPLPDTMAGNIIYYNPVKGAMIALDKDVEAWSDLWFYSNPIYIRLKDKNK